MRNAKNRAASFLLTTALLVSAVLPWGCTASAIKDTSDIEKLSAEFVEAVGTGDENNWKDLIDGDISDTVEALDYPDLSFKLASKITLNEIESVEADRENNKAKVRLKLSYIDISAFSENCIKDGIMSEDDYLALIDSYDSRDIKNLTLNFVYDENRGTWLIKNSSAEKYFDLVNQTNILNIAPISEEAFCGIITEVFEDFSEGNFATPYFTFDIDEVMIFDDITTDDPILTDAAEEFAKAYFAYIVDHGLRFEDLDYYYFYSAEVWVTAPSRYEILEYFSTDECVTNFYMAQIRSEIAPDKETADAYMMQMYADVYYDLAGMIPSMSGEEYSVVMILDPTGYELMFYDDIDFMPITESEVYAASQISGEQDKRCYEAAVVNLYLSGELTEEQYNSYMEELENGNVGAADYTNEDGYIVWSGTSHYDNQAVDVYEYVPDWSDGTMIYGASDIDSQGIYMHYSKEPGWLNTAGYCVSESGIVVMVTFDHKFAEGTVLEYDWEIDGVAYESDSVVVVQDRAVTFEFRIPETEIPKYGSVDFRLWEEGHSHVIAYVSLTQT